MTLVVDASALVALLADSGDEGHWATRQLFGEDLVAPALIPPVAVYWPEFAANGKQDISVSTFCGDVTYSPRLRRRSIVCFDVHPSSLASLARSGEAEILSQV